MMLWAMPEAAARSCASAVDMVEARIPASTTPASSAANTPFSLMRAAILTRIASAAEPLSKVRMAPMRLMAKPTIPTMMATVMEMTTHTVPTRREIFSFSSSLMAMKWLRIWGMPK